MFSSIWFWIILALIAIFVILNITGRKSVHHEIIINASPENVWAVLMDTDNYSSWNPVMKLVDGEIKEGNRVKYHFTQDEGNEYEIPSTVKKVVSNKLLNQGGGMPFILTFDHQYILEPLENRTKMVIHEDYTGIGVNFWNPKPVGKAYGRLNEALKKRIDSLNNWNEGNK